MIKEQPIFSPEELDKLAEFFVKHRNEPQWWNPAFLMALITFGAGLRTYEARLLRLEDCHLTPIPSVYIESEKGVRRARTVAILPEFRPYFEERIEFLRLCKKMAPRRASQITHLFPPGISQLGSFHRFVNVYGGPVGNHKVTSWWTNLMKAVGIEGKNSMTGRRTWATFLTRLTWEGPRGEQMNLSPLDLARQMGHSDLTMLVRYYDRAPAEIVFPCDRKSEWVDRLKAYEVQEFVPVMHRFQGRKGRFEIRRLKRESA